MNTVDARGRACPEPMMMTREALKSNADGVVMLVDEACAVENITRFATHMGYSVSKEADADDYKLTLTKNA